MKKPGASSASARDVSAAERSECIYNISSHKSVYHIYCISICYIPLLSVKFGAKGSSDSAKMPGASAASARDVSAAERSKCIYISSYNLVATGRM